MSAHDDSPVENQIRGRTRTGAALDILWWTALSVAFLYATWSSISRSGILGITSLESGDPAGDALQVRKALDENWFISGHHTDVGVSHPGPFGLWIRALMEWLHGYGLGATPLAAVTAGYLIVRVAVLFGAGALIAQTFKSRLAGAAFVLVTAAVLSQSDGRPTIIPLLHYLSPYPVILLLAAALAWACQVRGSVVWLALAAGMVSHLHTPSMPLGILGLTVVAVSIVKGRRERAQRIAAAIWALFTIPLLARVILEPGFPLNYIEASSRRIAARKANPEPFERFQFLGQELSMNGRVVFWMLVAAAVFLTAAASIKKFRRVAITLVVPVGYAVAVAATSYPHQSFASELLWIPGLWVFGGGLLIASGVAVVARFAGRQSDHIAAPVALVPAAAACVSLLGTPLSVWFDDQMVPQVSNVVEPYAAAGVPLAIAVEPGTLMNSAGVLLELQRRELPHCVTTTGPSETSDDVLETFISARLRCDPSKAYQVLVLTSFDGADYGDILFTYLPPEGVGGDGMLVNALQVQTLECGRNWNLDALAGCPDT